MDYRVRRLESVLFGTDRTRTWRALALAGVFVIVGAGVEYLTLITGFENELLFELHQFFALDGTALGLATRGAVIVVGLSAIQAYLNEGYLPSLLLGIAPAYGNRLWTIGSLDRIANLYLDPVSAAARTLPDGAILASFGFLLGIGIRWALRRRQRNSSETS
ncbi:hypothetical protein [Haladaptatus salinisoli]|uniref:hypothetical protein n=1 Tax=Haladaptatus salinisoli TaxID=2884876 RepID=UPI001D0A9225|nr:hypothetical protein [Haladaptatus salinisoli]